MSPSTTAAIVLLVHRNRRTPQSLTRPGPGSRVATSIPSEGWKRASVPVGVPGTGSGSHPGHWLFMKLRSKLRDTTKRYRGGRGYRLSASCFEYARLSDRDRNRRQAPLDRPWLHRCGRRGRWTQESADSETLWMGTLWARSRSEKRKENAMRRGAQRTRSDRSWWISFADVSGERSQRRLVSHR